MTMTIDIGADPIDRPSSWGSGWQWVDLNNPANERGIITHLKLFANADTHDCKVGTFFSSGTAGWYTCRSFATIPFVPVGVETTITGVAIDCEIDDLIGWFAPAVGRIERSTSGFAGGYYKSGDQSETGSQFYSLAVADAISVYGYSVFLPPTKEPWAIQNLTYYPSENNLCIVVVTDIPCHLFLRHTTHLPLVHQDPYYRRGIAIGTTPRFCFDIYDDNEELKAGDNLIHCFHKPAWLPDETHYFYLWGMIGGRVSPSETCIFTYPRKATVFTQIISEPWTA